jgi:hypothetical protein
MTIKDKVEGERTIPLTPYVASLLAGLPRRNEWVFSSPAAASGRLQEPRIMHNKALTAAGLPALSIHGLRRSFGTLAEWVECPAGVSSAQIMGHKPSATAEKHYPFRPLDLLRQWHTKIEGWILNEAGIEQPAEDATPRKANRLIRKVLLKSFTSNRDPSVRRFAATGIILGWSRSSCPIDACCGRVLLSRPFLGRV